MKKLLIIPVMFIYLFAVSGIMITAHYCGQELESWNVYVESDGCAGDDCSDVPEEEDGCCKDEIRLMKLKIDQTIAKLVQHHFSAPVIPTVSFSYLLPPPITDYITEEPVAHGPPLSEQDTYLQNRVFRI